MFTIVYTVRETLKTFGKTLIGAIRRYSANFRLGSSSRPRWRREADPPEIAGLCLYQILYKINFAMDLIHSCFILKITMYSFISFTGLSVCDRSITI